jgi:hypothetical protein
MDITKEIALDRQSYTLDSKRNFQGDSGNACESRKICSLIGLEKRRELNYVATDSFNVNPTQNDSQSTSLPPLSSFLLKCPHSPVMYTTIYPFAIALLNLTILLTTACFSLRAFKN